MKNALEVRWLTFGFLGLVLVAVLSLQTFLAIQDHYRIMQNTQIQDFIRHQAIVNHRTSLLNRHYVAAVGSCLTHGVHGFPQLLICAQREVNAE